MKKIVIVITLVICFSFCACRNNVLPVNSTGMPDTSNTSDTIIVKYLDPGLVIGNLPAEVSRINGDLNDTSSLLVGAFSTSDESSGQKIVDIKISPVLDSSALGDIVSKYALPTGMDGVLKTLKTSDLYGMITGEGNEEILGYFSLSDAFGDSFEEKTFQFHEKWDGNTASLFAFPVYVDQDEDRYILKSLMDGSTLRPDVMLPVEITRTADDSEISEKSVPLSVCGIAIFTINASEGIDDFSVHLLAYLKMTPKADG